MNTFLSKIETNNYQLFIIYDKQQSGLYNYFSSDTRMFEYIQQTTKEAFNSAIIMDSSNNYILNIASTYNYGAFDWKNEKELLNRQLEIFMPLIQLFIVKAVTSTL